MLTGRCAKAQTGHIELAVREGETLGYFLSVTSEVSAHFYVTPCSDLYLRCSDAQKKLLKKASTMEKENVPPDFVFRMSWAHTAYC